MDLPDDLSILHQPSRLKIMGHLARHRDAGFADTREATGLTDGNLAAHAGRLEAAGLIACRRVLHGRQGFQLRYSITRAGSEAFRRYLGVLRSFLEGTEQ